MRFKMSRVYGTDYLQIWDGDKFLMSCGKAETLYQKLVRLKELQEQTKKIEEIRTKLLSVEQKSSD